jgi:polyribonucleotide nucleotidyltransferase
LAIIKEIQIGGRTWSFETGRVAKQADGAVLVRFGDTMVLVTATAQREPKVGVPFLPLTVDYRENTYAAGKIPGGFFKREGRPNEKETLTSRLIDRPIRPLFPAGWNFETQVIALVLSADLENDPDILAVTGASAALCLSDIPFPNPIAATRVGLVDGNLIVNPTEEQLNESRLDLVVVGNGTDLVMVEAGAKEVTEEQMLEGLFKANEVIGQLVDLQRQLVDEAGSGKRPFEPRLPGEDTVGQIRDKIGSDLLAALKQKGKRRSYEQVRLIRKGLLEEIPDDEPERRGDVSSAFHELENRLLQEEVFGHNLRLDGRRFDEIRQVTGEVALLPRTHGSALFTRGETQALVTATLGTSGDIQKLDWMEGESFKRFMLHYNFPPFSVGEVKFLRGPGRREIGHGALAERAILPMMPSEDDFPYTVRLVSDILESNGSSSMATICGGVLALMDAGVPLKRQVAGIAMGLVKDGDKVAILSDIAGAEDHPGGMDFKVAGTRDGITALQMDIKVPGITRDIVTRALEQAHQGRMFILDRMQETISEPRAEISTYAPRLLTIRIPTAMIGAVIGPGGKMIRSIVERTGARIEVEDDGRVDIASVDETSARKAMELIQELVAEAEMGKTYLGKVKRITNFGAFVEILPRIEGLLHISEVSEKRIRDVHDEMSEGDEILVKVIDIDGDRVRLSRRAVIRDEKANTGQSGGGSPAPKRDDEDKPRGRDDKARAERRR